MPVRDAVLILAHEYSYCLQCLVKALDAPCFDLYVHVDAKTKNFDFDALAALARRAQIFFTPRRHSVHWGRPSLVKAELELFAAAGRRYRYYHLVSGSDLPVMPAEELFHRFDGHTECFIVAHTDLSYDTRVRLMFYHPSMLRPHPKAPQSPFNRFRDLLYRVTMAVQRRAHVNRLKPLSHMLGRPAKGHQWASLPRAAVDIILNAEPMIRRFVKATVCSDEMYKQTVLVNTPEAPEISSDGDLRFIDWSAGGANPAELIQNHFAEIDASGAVFARKFTSRATIDAFLNR